MSELTKEQWEQKQQAFYEAHPDCPKPKDVEVLNLIMRREYAEQILKGEKKLEFRAYSKHYHQRLIDKDAGNWLEAHGDELTDEEHEYFDMFRKVKTIHFHNYSNSWYLDVKCDDNYITAITRPNVEAFQEVYNCHDFDEMLADFEARNDNTRPLLFYFVIGEVIDTNL